VDLALEGEAPGPCYETRTGAGAGLTFFSFESLVPWVVRWLRDRSSPLLLALAPGEGWIDFNRRWPLRRRDAPLEQAPSGPDRLKAAVRQTRDRMALSPGAAGMARSKPSMALSLWAGPAPAARGGRGLGIGGPFAPPLSAPRAWRFAWHALGPVVRAGFGWRWSSRKGRWLAVPVESGGWLQTLSARVAVIGADCGFTAGRAAPRPSFTGALGFHGACLAGCWPCRWWPYRGVSIKSCAGASAPLPCSAAGSA